MSVYAGNGVVGFSGDGSAATGAQMNGPSGMCFDSNDNLYIADSDNAVIRVVIGPGAVTPPSLTGPVTAGSIYTAVGIQTSTNPVFGGDGTPALSSHLHFPDGCAFDTHGNLYIADRGNNEIRVVIGTAAVTPPGLTGPLTPGQHLSFRGCGWWLLSQSADRRLRGRQLCLPLPERFTARSMCSSTPATTSSSPISATTLAPMAPRTHKQVSRLNNNVIREVLASDGTIHTVAGVQGAVSKRCPQRTACRERCATAVALTSPRASRWTRLVTCIFATRSPRSFAKLQLLAWLAVRSASSPEHWAPTDSAEIRTLRRARHLPFRPVRSSMGAECSTSPTWEAMPSVLFPCPAASPAPV